MEVRPDATAKVSEKMDSSPSLSEAPKLEDSSPSSVEAKLWKSTRPPLRPLTPEHKLELGGPSDTNTKSLNSSLAETKTTGGEDAECFCFAAGTREEIWGPGEDNELLDLDSAGDDEYDSIEHCSHHAACPDLCDAAGKIVYFEGKTQSISFCGKKEAYGDWVPYDGDDSGSKCICMDLKETFRTYKSQFGSKDGFYHHYAVPHSFAGSASALDNLQDCYAACPILCHNKGMVTGGCAYPSAQEASRDD